MLINRLRRYFGLHLCRIVSRPLTEEPIAVGPLNTHISYGVIGERELLHHCSDPELYLSKRHVRLAYARGDLCVAAFHGTILVGYQWFAFGPTPHVNGIWVDFDIGACYCYKQLVRPQYRGQRIAAGLTTCGGRSCMQRGCRRTVALINLDNEASWHAASRVGNRTVGYAGCVNWLGLFLSFRTPGAKGYGFRFYAPPHSAVPLGADMRAASE